MIIHIVMFTLKDFAEGKGKSDNLIIMKEKLESLIDSVDLIRKIEVGLNINTNPAAYDIVLYSEFDSDEDLDAYQIHPEHRKVSDFIGEISDKRVVVDYER